MNHTTEDFASINLDTENPTLKPAAKSIRNTIRNEHNIPDTYRITIYGIEAWLPENRLTVHVHIEDENNNNVTEKYDEAKHYHAIDNMNPLSDNELETLKQLHKNNSSENYNQFKQKIDQIIDQDKELFDALDNKQ